MIQSYRPWGISVCASLFLNYGEAHRWEAHTGGIRSTNGKCLPISGHLMAHLQLSVVVAYYRVFISAFNSF